MSDFLDKLLEEIHEENINKKKEAEELLEKLAEEEEKVGFIKLFERLK